MVKASAAGLKFWMMARCSSLAMPRSVHHSVGTTPVKPPMPPMKPPTAPATPSPIRPPQATFGRLDATSMIGQHTTSTLPRASRNTSAFRCGNTAMPSGMPTAPPARNGASAVRRKCRRLDSAATTCPVSEPNTAITAATRGSMPQTQKDMATMPNAKPESPCTNPATAAPTTSNQSSGVMLI